MKKTNGVGNNIKRFRENEGITQEGLALKSGLSQGYINQLENGKRRYTQKTLELIADSLSVPIIEFFKEENEKRTAAKVDDLEIYVAKKKTYKKDFPFLLKGLPDHIIEHYISLLRLEKELLERTNKA
ncbi:MAG: helix-turn-helix transcriptional regulator [Deltaproteobacteria bacterium]